MSTISKITQEYDLNMIPGGVDVYVHVNQYDSGNRQLIFNLYFGGAPYLPTDDADVTVGGSPPGGDNFTVSGTVAGNMVTVDVVNYMTQVAGEVPCWVRVSDGNGQVCSAAFKLVVHKCDANDPLTLERYYYLADVPSGYRPAVDAALASGALTGYGGSGKTTIVKLSKDMCRMLTVMARAQLFGPFSESGDEEEEGA